MHLPENSETFKSIVVEKIKTYCDTNIWPFSYEQFAAWLSNFDCKKEEYLALQILDNLIVRSNSMAKASYARLLHSTIRQFLIENSLIEVGTIQKWKSHLVNGTLAQSLRFCPVKLDNDQGESGSVIYRMLSEELDTDRYSYAKATKPPKVVVLIDDFIGSGSQFDDFANQIGLEDLMQQSTVLYCPLIGFELGIKKIQKKYSQLQIHPAELIYEADGFFYGNDKELFKNDLQNTVADVKQAFANMHVKYAPKMDNWFGYEEAGLPLAFEWGCPNQTPPLLYMYKSKYVQSWQQLFGRRA